MAKGFKDNKGKFRPTESPRKRATKFFTQNPNLEGSNPDIKKASELKEQKLTSKVELLEDFGNEAEEKTFKVKGVEARPEIDEKVIPVEFFVKSFNILEATGDNQFVDKPFIADLVLAPKNFGKKRAMSIQSESGLDPKEDKFTTFDVLSGGHFLDIEQASGKTEAEVVNKVTENVEALAGLIGFTLDRRINSFGKTGWDVLEELALDKPFKFGSTQGLTEKEIKGVT